MAENTRMRKRQKLSCFIDKLPDSLLAKVFSYLPPKERFQLSAVCKQWQAVSQILWTDVKRLRFSEFSSVGINTILNICPNVREAVISRDQRIILDDKSMPPMLSRLESLKLYDVCFAMQDSGSATRIERKYERLLSEYFNRFPHLSELIWHNMYGIDSQGNLLKGKLTINDRTGGTVEPCASFYVATLLAHSLRRLQLTYGPETFTETDSLIAALGQLENLACLYLGGPGLLYSPDRLLHYNPKGRQAKVNSFFAVLGKMSNLRELCFGELYFRVSDLLSYEVDWTDLRQLEAVACEKLLKLEVLIFASFYRIAPGSFRALLTTHPSLRILVISGQDGLLKWEHEQLQANFVPVLLPRRSLLSPIDQRPLPLLRVFVGGRFLQFVRFRAPEADAAGTVAAKFTEIDCPMSQFLAKPEVAEIFEGVWVAKMISEGAQNGVEPWGSPSDCDWFYSNNLLQFAN